MSLHNSNIYKLGKVVLKEAPEAIKLLDESYSKLYKYTALRQIRLLLFEMNKTKEELLKTIDTAKKVVQNKGRINK